MSGWNPYLRQEGNGVFLIDIAAIARDASPPFKPSLRARLLGAGAALKEPRS